MKFRGKSLPGRGQQVQRSWGKRNQPGLVKEEKACMYLMPGKQKEERQRALEAMGRVDLLSGPLTFVIHSFVHSFIHFSLSQALPCEVTKTKVDQERETAFKRGCPGCH